ncbi:MAG: hypothetical protein JNM81_01815 [Rhodospirillaceae bacterium]|nr:hypothetical protein [Rhodospirillaceae bacterium]
MAADSMLESVLVAQRVDTLSRLSNAAQASEQQRARQAVGEISDQARNAQDLNTATLPTNLLPVDPSRGRNLNIVA